MLRCANMRAYDHRKIEEKWQKIWAKSKIYSTPDKAPGKDNFYLLVEFPYPSGNLHVGHWYAFAVPDILARMLRMQGKNVMYPIGFDAFGLPAENAAIKNKLNPRTWTEKNIAYMTKQIESMGTSFDWSREVRTIDPEYYKWTQWLFLQLYKKGLVYQKETAVNWCANDKTVLANEQVVDGKCERCGHDVVQKQMLQWNIKITDYADRLIDDLAPLNWPEQIKESQRNWIGRSEGAEIDFPLDLGHKNTYLYLHGYKSGADRPRNRWYRKHLEALGHAVVIPELPNSDNPREDEQVAAALNATKWNENTIVVGHSLGGMVAMKALLKHNKKIAGLVLVAPAVNPEWTGVQRKPFHSTFDWDIDFERIRKITGYRIVLSDVQETHRAPHLRRLSLLLDARLVETTAVAEHFIGDTEPDVLMWMRPTIRVFTTRADTLFGATYLVLAPEHPWITLALQHKTVLKNNAEVKRYVEKAAKKTELERQTDQKVKTGVELKGVRAINPATGEEIPLWVADYVLGHYGTGAVMGVPAHDERDFEFAKKFDLTIRNVIEPVIVNRSGPDAFHEHDSFDERGAVMVLVKHWSEEKYLCLKSPARGLNYFICGGIENGEDPIVAGKREIEEETGYTNAEFVRQLGGKIHTKFFHTLKKYNRFAHFTPLLFELKSSEWHDIADSEKAIHEVVWMDTKDIEAFLTREDVKIAWSRVYDGQAYTGDGILTNSNDYNGMTVSEGKKAIGEAYGRMKKTYKLRDWIVSRQRYWGVPIPMVHCPTCGVVPVPDKELPVELPAVKDYLPDGRGKSPLAKVKKFVNVKCPQCGGKAERETDTLDTFVDSSWYFLRYTDPKNKKKFAGAQKMANWMPVNLYSGGAEHTTMHLLYSRFWHKALFDLGFVANAEPYARRMNRSIILGPDGQKMSKSRGNVVDPDEVVKRLGADTVRMYLAFIGPYNEVSSFPWNPDGVVGVRRFLERAWRIQDFVSTMEVNALSGLLHKTIKKVGDDIAAMKFNTAISALMIFLNAVEKEKNIGQSQWRAFLQLLAPFAPHVADELWGGKKSIHIERWPKFDELMLQDETVTIAVQINGKTRGEVAVAASADKDAVEKAARELVAGRLQGKTIQRTIVVPGRLVNFVVAE